MDKFVGSSEMKLREIFDKPPDIYEFFRSQEADNGDAIAKAVRICTRIFDRRLVRRPLNEHLTTVACLIYPFSRRFTSLVRTHCFFFADDRIWIALTFVFSSFSVMDEFDAIARHVRAHPQNAQRCT